MLEQFDAKPGSESVATVAGDMAQITMERTYGLVYLVFNTIGNLMTQDAQVACFRNAALHLEVGGHFVIESNVPNLRRLTPGAHGCVFGSTDNHVGIDHYTDLVEQQAVSRHFHFDGSPGEQRVGVTSVRYEETPFRFTWPVRARPDGAARWHAPNRAMGGLAPERVRRRQPRAHLRVAQRLTAPASTANPPVRCPNPASRTTGCIVTVQT